jgi:exodeoxyribonuclease V gamma subunit
MFYLHLSNRTENLLTHLVEVLRAQPRRSLFDKEVFLIQSQGMERMLSQRLADAFGVWCNFEYMLPTRFFDHMADRMGMVINPDAYDRESLTWRLDALLRQIADAETGSELFAPLLHYMSGEQGNLKRYQLAQQLANIFDQYQIMRPEMLESWEHQKTSTDNPAEPWQMALWLRLRASLDNGPHRGEMLRQFLQLLQEKEDARSILPARLSIFGLHSMPPLLLDCLHGVSNHCDVHLYLLSPCQNYWTDMPGKRRLIRENLARLREGLEPIPLVDQIYPLLKSLGQQGRDFQAMLLERLDDPIEFRSFVDPTLNDLDDPSAPPCLLHRLQSDLLDGGWQERRDDETIPLDHSLSFVSCHSATREVMILKDQILRWLQDNPEMELRDIVVMAPDIQEYAPIIPAIFHDIQHSIADRGLRHQNSGLAIFLQFLDLATGRCGWSEVLDLLERPEVASALDLSESDCELIRHWVTSSGIRWGLSPAQGKGWGVVAMAETSWQAGLDRLLLGYAMDFDQPVDGILPYPDIEGSQARPLGSLCHFIEMLTRAADDFSRSRPLDEWSTLLLSAASALFSPDQEGDWAPLRELLTTLGQRFSPFHQHDIPLEVVRAWLESAASESRSSSGFLRGQLTFCSMLPMRSIPLQAVCLLGLNDGVFPKTDRHPPFDLLGETFRPGDRSKRGDDRYQFLEALLSARRYLYLSYVGQSIRSNQTIPPSVLITELIETLRLAYGIEDPVQAHPLQPFSARYFAVARPDANSAGADSTPALFSYNQYNCEVAQALTARTAPAAAPWWSGSLPDDDCRVINIGDLFSFFGHPQKWFVRSRLGLRLDTEIEQPLESELFSIGGLDKYLVNQELIETCLHKPADLTTTALAKLKAQGRWMLGTPGQLAFDRQLPSLSDFAGKIQAKDMGRRIPDIPVDLEIAGYHLLGQLSDLYENGVLLARYTDCKGKDLLKAWIHHLLAAAVGLTATTHLLTKDRKLCFAPVHDPLTDLAQLLTIYHQGYRQPSLLLVEPAWAFVLQEANRRGQKSPLEAAIQKFRDATGADYESLWQAKRGYEPEWQLLYGDCDPRDLLGAEFQGLCREFLGPIWLSAQPEGMAEGEGD